MNDKGGGVQPKLRLCALQNQISPLLSECYPSIIQNPVCGRRSIWLMCTISDLPSKSQMIWAQHSKRVARADSAKTENDSALKLILHVQLLQTLSWLLEGCLNELSVVFYFGSLHNSVGPCSSFLRTGRAKSQPNLGWRRRTEMLLKNCHRQYHRHCDQRQDPQKTDFL